MYNDDDDDESMPSSRGEILISFTELQVGFDRIPIPSILSGELITFIRFTGKKQCSICLK